MTCRKNIRQSQRANVCERGKGGESEKGRAHEDKTKQKLHALGTCDSDDDSDNIAAVVVLLLTVESKLQCRAERAKDRQRVRGTARAGGAERASQ